jgi:hypothetical protein
MQKWVVDVLQAMVAEHSSLSNSKIEQQSMNDVSGTKVLGIIESLAESTGLEASSLQAQFGQSLFDAFILRETPRLFPASNSFELLQQMQTLIDLEGHRLYSGSQPPRFEFLTISEEKMIMDYRSPRPFGLICYGLIQGCIDYFAEDIELKMQLIDGALNHVRFTLNRIAKTQTRHK